MMQRTGKEKWIFGIAALCGALWTVGAMLFYRYLVALQAGDMAAYTLPFLLPVAAGAALCYVFVALQIRRWVRLRTLPEDAEKALEDPSDGADMPASIEDTEMQPGAEPEEKEPLAEWEGLFRMEAAPPEQEDMERGWSEKIAAALASQRTQVTDAVEPEETASSTEADPWDALYSRPATEPVHPSDLYEGLSDAPLSDYSLPSEEASEEGEVEETLAAPRPALSGILSIVVLLAVFAAGFLLACSCFTAAGEEGIRVFRAGRVTQYSAAQVERYTIRSAFFGGDLELRFQMRDGRTVSLSPERMSTTADFDAAYENVYAFWNMADQTLGARNVPKTVEDAGYLTDAYSQREDGTWELVRALLDLPSE